jgi:hypothetical protein
MRGRIVLLVLVLAVATAGFLLWNMEHRPGGIRSVQKVETEAPAAQFTGSGTATFGSSQTSH